MARATRTVTGGRSRRCTSATRTCATDTVRSEDLPTRSDGSMLPAAKGTAVVGGIRSRDGNHLFLHGRWRDADEAARSISRETTWAPGKPVVLIAGGAATVKDAGQGTFAARLAASLG